MKNHNRRDFIKQVSATGAVLATGAFASCTEKASASCSEAGTDENIRSKLIIPKAQGLKISGTFLDEISHDIPHQNWGEKEWDRDFAYMKAIGIDTVIVIRSGYRKFITYPSEYLMKTFGCYMPSVDLIDMYLRLSDKYGMKFFFGLYDSGKYWDTGDLTWEIESRKSGRNTGIIKVSRGGIFVRRSVARPRGRSRRSVVWASSARRFQAACRLLSLRGSTGRKRSLPPEAT